VFDKGYCHSAGGERSMMSGAFFVTRAKVNMRLRAVERRPVEQSGRDGFTIINDAEVVLHQQGQRSPADSAARIASTRQGRNADTHHQRSDAHAVENRRLYNAAGQIELLFRWIKQHLRIPQVPRQERNAIRLQILAP